MNKATCPPTPLVAMAAISNARRNFRNPLAHALLFVGSFMALNLAGRAHAGGAFGRCTELIIANTNLTDKCAEVVRLERWYSFVTGFQLGSASPPFLEARFTSKATGAFRISFNFEKINYANDGEAELAVGSVSVYADPQSVSTNRGDLVPATGYCRFKGLGSGRPELICSASSKETPSRLYKGSLVYDRNSVSEISRCDRQVINVDPNCNRANDYRDFIAMAKKFYDNPDGPCAKPINQSMEMCARIRNRAGVQKYPTQKVANSAPPKNKRSTDWVGNANTTPNSIRNGADAKRECPVVCNSLSILGPWTGNWRREPLTVIRGNQYQRTVYVDSSCECYSTK